MIFSGTKLTGNVFNFSIWFCFFKLGAHIIGYSNSYFLEKYNKIHHSLQMSNTFLIYMVLLNVTILDYLMHVTNERKTNLANVPRNVNFKNSQKDSHLFIW